MNPVQETIAEHASAHYNAWRARAEEPTPARAGARYLAADVAALLALPLASLGLRAYEDPYGTRLLVATNGKQATRDSLASLVAGALAHHPDEILRQSVSSPAVWSHITDRMPYDEGETVIRRVRTGHRATRSSADYMRAARARQNAAEEASARAFIAAARPRLEGLRIVSQDLYDAAVRNISRKAGESITDAEDSEFWTVPRRRLFYRIADDELGALRRHTCGTAYVVEGLRALRRLSARTLDVLRLSAETLQPGEPLPDFETEADEFEARIGRLEAMPAPDPEHAAIVRSALRRGVRHGSRSSTGRGPEEGSQARWPVLGRARPVMP